MNPLLTLVIPTVGRKSVYSLLSSIENQTFFLKTKVLVVCNPANSILEKYLKSKPNFSYMISRQGANFARNVGWQAAQTPWVYFLDDDVILPDSRHLERSIQFLKEKSESAVIGGPYHFGGRKKLAQLYHQLQNRWYSSGYLGSSQWVHLLGGNLLVRREAMSSPLFCESLLFGGTETELFFRMAQKGLSLQKAENLFVVHDVKMSLLDFMFKNFQQGVGQAYLSSQDYYREPFIYQEHSLSMLPSWADRKLLSFALFCNLTGQQFYKKNNRLMSSKLQIVQILLATLIRQKSEKLSWTALKSAFRNQAWSAYLDAETLRERYRKKNF